MLLKTMLFLVPPAQLMVTFWHHQWIRQPAADLTGTPSPNSVEATPKEMAYEWCKTEVWWEMWPKKLMRSNLTLIAPGQRANLPLHWCGFSETNPFPRVLMSSFRARVYGCWEIEIEMEMSVSLPLSAAESWSSTVRTGMNHMVCVCVSVIIIEGTGGH